MNEGAPTTEMTAAEVTAAASKMTTAKMSATAATAAKMGVPSATAVTATAASSSRVSHRSERKHGDKSRNEKC
jgi:hypothetical protein